MPINPLPMNYPFHILSATRNNLLKATEGFDLAAMNQIPAGFRNNLIWHLGHVLITQQLLCYRNAGLPCAVPDEMIDRYRKGSAPTAPVAVSEITFIREMLTATPEQLQQDLNKGIFAHYKGCATSYGVHIADIEDAITFNNVHEGLHLGYVMAMRKLVGE